MINGVILQKLQTLDEILVELRSLGRVTVKQLNSDWRTQRAIERDLQVLVEIVIDICQRIISLSGQSPAATGADAIARCIQSGVLSEQDAYRQMAQFRNFIVHRYERIDVEILANMVNRHLNDFEKFREDILAYAKNNKG
ncbi:MAG TPA: DUF86 domain-containing protein [Chloroflexi bacterium]|nr:MAG: hypothetical protein B6243_01605 [Anaerolineaceae bacterium 4572_5.2]HEY86064.1 DUF86 domain-containing protein [Chloroflexota bacterium]